MSHTTPHELSSSKASKGVHYPLKFATPNVQCPVCGSDFKPRHGQVFCSASCRNKAHRAKTNKAPKPPTQSKTKRLKAKTSKLLTSTIWRWIKSECLRAGTVEILGWIKTADDFKALTALRRRATKHSEYQDSIPVGSFHLSHVLPVKGHPTLIGLLSPQNLVIAPANWNRSHRTLPLEGKGQGIERSSLQSRYRVNSETSDTKLLKQIRSLVSPQVFDGWLSGLSLPATRREQLLKLLQKHNIKGYSRASVDEMLTVIADKGLEVYLFSKSSSDELEVLIEELSRLQPRGSLLIVANYLHELLWSLDHLETKDDRQLRDWVLLQGLSSLHGLEYSLIYKDEHVLTIIKS